MIRAFPILLAMLMPIFGAQPYNILVILADDYGQDFTNVNTDPAASIPPTPNLDALATNGIRFTEFRTMQACAMSRASLLTGRCSYRTNVVGNADPLPSAEFTMSDDLNDNHGYTSGMVGKWNLGAADGNNTPRTIGGFDYFAGSYAVSGFAVSNHFSYQKTIDGGAQFLNTDYITTDEIDDAITWTGSASEPWFMSVWLHAAHTAGGINQYPPTDLHSYGGTPGADGGVTAYKAMIEAMDTEIGRLLATVDFSQTIVVFMGDNGSTFANGSIPANRIKGNFYDNAIRSPLIIRSPGMSGAGTRNSTRVNITDIYPTLMKLATDSAHASPNTVDGRDFSGVFRGEVVPTRSAQYCTDGTDRSACDGDYRLLDKASGTDEFYNLRDDPYEQNNLGTVGLAGPALKAYNNLRYALTTFTAKTDEQPVVEVNYAQPSVVTGGIRVVRGGVSVVAPTVGSATITAPLKDGATDYTLWVRVNPFGSWEDSGLTESVGSVVSFTDPNPTGRKEYRITNNAPEP